MSSPPLWQSHPTDAQDDAYEGSELQRSSHLPRRHTSTGFGSNRSSRADPTSGSTGMSPLPPIHMLARGNSESGAQIVPQGSPATTPASPRGDSSTARLQRWNTAAATAAATAAGAGEAALADDPGAGDVEMGEMRSNIR